MNAAGFAVTAFCVAAPLAASCDHSTAPPPAVPASITVSGSPTVGLRARLPLSPVVRDASGKDVSAAAHIQWTSSNPAVASVSDSGVVFGAALGGPVTITGTAGGATSATTLSVVPSDVVITPVLAGLELNTTQQMSADPRDFLGASISAGAVVWSSSAPGIASVDPASGLLRAVSRGDAVISATVAGRTSALGIFVDTATVYDGVYASFGSNDPVQTTVALGRVADFSAVVHYQGCVMTVAAHPQALISDATNGSVVVHRAAFVSGNGGTTVSIQFTPAGTMTGSMSGSSFFGATSCTTGANSSTQGTFVFSANR